MPSKKLNPIKYIHNMEFIYGNFICTLEHIENNVSIYIIDHLSYVLYYTNINVKNTFNFNSPMIFYKLIRDELTTKRENDNFNIVVNRDLNAVIWSFNSWSNLCSEEFDIILTYADSINNHGNIIKNALRLSIDMNMNLCRRHGRGSAE